MKAINIFNQKSLLGMLVAAMGAFGGSSVFAATETGSMGVSGTLVSACTVSAATLDFGDNIIALLSEADVTADTGNTLQIACTTGTNPKIYSATARTLAGSGTAAGSSIAFNLSQTAGAAADNLPVDAIGAEAITGYTANGAEQAVVIYGRVPVANYGNQPAGPYSATIVMSVDY
ncbi:spore coat protein U domain-containing protein [Nitrosomonas communis]|uniref:spore coat protein U domain-containing protein n=1 Tax=Nitrosomonas communis TaxID=44574 RepID=UPI003D277F65